MMLLWVRVERALAEACRSVMGRDVGGSLYERSLVIRARLEARAAGGETLHADMLDLPDRIDRVRQVRNMIVHSLAGVSADPAQGEPHIICERGEGAQRHPVRITQGELTRLLAEMDRCRSDLEWVGSRLFERRSPERRL